MKYILLDSNIYIRFITQGRPGCEPTHFDALAKLVDGDSYSLLLPEVVELECEKFSHNYERDVETRLAPLAEALKVQIWNEVEDVAQGLKAQFDELKAQKLKDALKRNSWLQQFWQAKNVIRLPLTPEILFAAKKRLIAGRMPKPERANPEKAKPEKPKPDRLQDCDASTIESMLVFFTPEKRLDATLLFCTENVGEFFLKAKDKLVLHPRLSLNEGMPTTHCYEAARPMLDAINTHSAIADPTPEEVLAALRHEQEEEEQKRQREAQEEKYTRARNLFFMFGNPPGEPTSDIDEWLSRFRNPIYNPYRQQLPNLLGNNVLPYSSLFRQPDIHLSPPVLEPVPQFLHPQQPITSASPKPPQSDSDG